MLAFARPLPPLVCRPHQTTTLRGKASMLSVPRWPLCCVLLLTNTGYPTRGQGHRNRPHPPALPLFSHRREALPRPAYLSTHHSTMGSLLKLPRLTVSRHYKPLLRPPSRCCLNPFLRTQFRRSLLRVQPSLSRSSPTLTLLGHLGTQPLTLSAPPLALPRHHSPRSRTPTYPHPVLGQPWPPW